MLTPELKQKMIEYLQREISLQELEEWMVPYESHFLADHDSADADAISAIELGLAEWSAGLCSEEDVRRLLKEVIEQYETVQLSPSENDRIRTTWTSELSQNEQSTVSLNTDTLIAT